MVLPRQFVVPPSLSVEDIRVAADRFLVRHGWQGEIPVDVEHILDVRMGIDIVREPNLTDRIQVEGFLSRNRRTIYVDDYTQDVLEKRYRYTLAHEAGHHELHQWIYDRADFKTVEEFKSFLGSIPESVKALVEFQANCFADFLLAPKEQLRSAIQEAAFRARSRFYETDIQDPVDRGYLMPIVTRRLKVSGDLIERRGRHDGLWS
jgi:hypothetical protein